MPKKLFKLPDIKSQAGQIAVIVMLVMVVLLVLGLSLATRTTQEVSLTTQETESTRVFNAAESGAEKALNEVDFSAGSFNDKIFEDVDNNANVTYSVSTEDELITTLTEGESATVQLSSTGTVQIEWANGQTACSGANSGASIIVTQYYLDSGVPKVQTRAFGPTNCSARNTTDKFETADSGTAPYNNQQSINLAGTNPRLMRIKPVYNGTEIRVTGSSLPAQSHVVRSEASNKAGGEVRAVQVTRTIPAPPNVLDYAVYSGGSLSKN